MKEKTYKVAFIGGNIRSAIGRTHKIACQMDGKFELVAAAFSRNKEVNTETANEYNIPLEHVYDDYKELLEKEKNNVDVVIVLVSTDFHEQIVMDCLNGGYKVICEKSLSTSFSSGEKIVNCMKKNNGFLGLIYNYTGYPMLRVLKEKIEQNVLGKIISINIEMPQEGYIRYTSKGKIPSVQSWRLKDYTIPTISLDLGVHLHNIIAFLINEKPIKVTATENSFGFFKGLIDDVSCLIQYTNDINVKMWYSKSALGNRNGLKIRIFGEKASAQWYQMEPEILKISKNDGSQIVYDRSNDNIGLSERYNRFKAGHPIGFIEAFANYYDDLYEAIENFEQGKEFSTKYILPIEKSLEGLKLFELAHKSSKEEKWIDYI